MSWFRKRQKEILACDLLTGHGGLSVAEARRLAGMAQVDPEKDYYLLQQKINESQRIEDERIEFNKRKEKLKNPRSIYLRRKSKL